ncbi:hypothetical protein DSECCO2_226730 [anaerobic digester metagenome]
MDTNNIKKFAIGARNKLKEGVAMKMASLGFNKNGEVADNLRPTLVQGGSFWKGEIQTEGFYHQWMSLYNRIQEKGMNEVYEEAAYTWFNRLVAIRILQKNELAEPILDFADVARTPRIVDAARSGRIPTMKEEQRSHLVELLDDDTKTTEQFALLITAWCHQNPIIEKCFGAMGDYTELLLPNNILAEGGFMEMLNHTTFIDEADYQSPELIGWLYQFYISERKDEVFAKKGKYTPDEIPAATQIFTPNWIVKYMVQNTIGRIYLDNNPYAAAKENWKYLVEAEPTPEANKYRYSELTDLKVADLACGSGHILNECFDILFDLYVSEGYTRSEAIENIFRHNLTGIDLDKRAKQLATFALLLKACQCESSYIDAHCLPNVLTMPKPLAEELRKPAISTFMQGCETAKMLTELDAAFGLMQDADSLGSIMKFDISDGTRFALLQAMTYWEAASFVQDEVQKIIPAIKLILALTEKYAAIVMNPPYMGGGKMNAVLAKYVEKNYKEGKADLFSVFMYVGMERLNEYGKQAQINMQSWMFLSSFEKLRSAFLTNYHIDSMLHLGPRTFDELSGEVVQNTAFVLGNNKPQAEGGNYYRLIDGKSCGEKERMFLAGDNYYPNIPQQNFSKIPGSPIAYWVSERFLYTFEIGTQLRELANVPKGLSTGNVERFMRLWYECNFNKIDLSSTSCDDSKTRSYKWFPYAKGGAFRRWNGNLEYIVNWENDGYEVKSFVDDMGKQRSRPQNTSYYFKECLTYSAITSGKYSLRYLNRTIFGGGGDAIHSTNSNDTFYILAFMNSSIAQTYLGIISPTLNFEVDHIKSIPIIRSDNNLVKSLSQQNITLSRLDWDAHETSWDFQTNELIALSQEGLANIQASINDELAMNYSSLELLYQEYKTKWTTMFHQLHANEEELNRQFIDIYGLQDELTPDVPLNEITILQQGEVKIVDGALQFQADVVIKQLISYAIGCWMGRYRLDKPGLYIAHPDVKEEEIVTYPYRDETLTIDDDGIIPILPYECPFEDNLQNRIADFVRIAFGNDSLAENLNFVEQALGCTIEKYLDKEYWKDHKKMYQNRPIYWLWSSKKGTFKVISYMHRMDAYTAESVRSKYLLPYIEYLNNKIADLESRAAQLSVGESRKLDALRKAHTECVEYHERLQVVAEQAIAFDLDDGVVVNYAKFGDVLAKLK